MRLTKRKYQYILTNDQGLKVFKTASGNKTFKMYYCEVCDKDISVLEYPTDGCVNCKKREFAKLEKEEKERLKQEWLKKLQRGEI